MADIDVARYGYHWDQADRSVIHFSSPDIPRLVLSSPTAAQRYGMGILDRLPLEILHQVLGRLDFHTLIAIRSLNLASRSIVDSFPSFKYMTQYAANALRALSRTRLIIAFSAAHLLSVLRTDRCLGCQRYGAFLFLLTCSRCCFNCLETDTQFYAIPLATAKSSFGLKDRDLRRLPTMLSLPGTYALLGRRSVKRRFRLVSAVEAYTLAKALYGDVKTTLAAVLTQSATKPRAFRERVYASMPMSLRDPFCGFTSTAFPTLDIKSMCVQSGISCRGCDDVCRRKFRGELKRDDGGDLLARRNDNFSQDEFEQHIKRCEGVNWLRAFYLRDAKEAANYFSRLEFWRKRSIWPSHRTLDLNP